MVDVEAAVEDVLERLRSDGGRATTGRRAIVTALLTGIDHHVTAETVAAVVQAEHPDVHLSTVYRALEALERAGVVARLQLGPGGAVWHLTDHAHHHLVCEECGQVVEVRDRRLDAAVDAVGRETGFRLSGHVALTGRCPACAE